MGILIRGPLIGTEDLDRRANFAPVMTAATVNRDAAAAAAAAALSPVSRHLDSMLRSVD
jgi:hypothetical protein